MRSPTYLFRMTSTCPTLARGSGYKTEPVPSELRSDALGAREFLERSYSDRKKFSTACWSLGDKVLNRRMTWLASDPLELCC